MPVQQSARRSASSPERSGAPLRGAPLRWRRPTTGHLLLAAFDVAALYLLYSLARQGRPALPGALLVMLVLVNWVALSRRLYPIRWLAPGLVLMLLMVVYPLLSTIYTAFTNTSDGHTDHERPPFGCCIDGCHGNDRCSQQQHSCNCQDFCSHLIRYGAAQRSN